MTTLMRLLLLCGLCCVVSAATASKSIQQQGVLSSDDQQQNQQTIQQQQQHKEHEALDSAISSAISRFASLTSKSANDDTDTAAHKITNDSFSLSVITSRAAALQRLTQQLGNAIDAVRSNRYDRIMHNTTLQLMRTQAEKLRILFEIQRIKDAQLEDEEDEKSEQREKDFRKMEATRKQTERDRVIEERDKETQASARQLSEDKAKAAEQNEKDVQLARAKQEQRDKMTAEATQKERDAIAKKAKEAEEYQKLMAAKIAAQQKALNELFQETTQKATAASNARVANQTAYLEESKKQTDRRLQAERDRLFQEILNMTSNGTLETFSGTTNMYLDDPINYRLEGGICSLSGTLKSRISRIWITTTPVNCRPSGRISFNQYGVNSTSPDRIDILENGEVRWVAGPESNYISLNNIRYPVAHLNLTNIQLNLPWQNLGDGESGNAKFIVSNDSTQCSLSGTVRVNSKTDIASSSLIGTLPLQCRPVERLIFWLNHDTSALRVDVLPTGEIRYVSGTPTVNWISLAGITFYLKSGAAIPLNTNTWGPAGDNYRAPNTIVVGNFCYVSGAVRSVNPTPLIMLLPINCRPRYNTTFVVAQEKGPQRIDIVPTGEVRWNGPLNVTGILSVEMVFRAANLTEANEAMRQDRIVRLGNLPRDANVTLNTRVNPATGYNTPRVSVRGSLCLVSGVIETANININITTLPENCRPAGRLSFDQHVDNGASVRVDVNPDGVVGWGEGSNGMWLALDNIRFPVVGVPLVPFNLTTPWTNASAQGFSNASFLRQDDYCMLTGAVVIPPGKAWTDEIGVLPRVCRPADGRIVFTVSQPGGSPLSARIDVLQNGSIVFMAGRRTVGAVVSLDGIGFMIDSSDNLLKLSGNYTGFGREYRRPCYERQDDMCTVSGLIQSSGEELLAVLPLDCRPLRRTVFHLNQHNMTARFDLKSNGELTWIGQRNNGWFSLDGITFVADSVTNTIAAAIEAEKAALAKK